MNYLDLDEKQLISTLCDLVIQLGESYDSLGFLRSTELETKKGVWISLPEASIQTRDRTATYAATEITTQILQLETTIQRLNLERVLIERLIDRA